MKRWNAARLRAWTVVVGTVSLAFLSGYIMQSRGPGPTEPVLTQDVVLLPEAPTARVSLRQPPSLKDRIAQTRAIRKEGCDPTLTLGETPNGQMDVALVAPCHAGAPITVEMNQLIADETVDAYGRWAAQVPAFERDMHVTVTLEDTVLRARRVFEPSIKPQHIILAWQDERIFEVHAHAHHGPLSASRGEIENGSQPPVATTVHVGDGRGAAFEILTFPPQSMGATGVVRLSVEARVTETNCAREASTRAYQTGYLGALRLTEIAYTMPDCDRVGEVVRLQNLFRDMRLAER